MLNKILLSAFLATAALAPVVSQAQAPTTPCGTYEAMEEYLRHNPGYAQELKNLDAQIRQASQNPALRSMQASTFVVPVVIHIIHDNTGSNITRAQVMDAMRVLNEDFNKLNADSGQVISAFQPIFANVQVEFRLAQRDPAGNCTEGITRTFSTLTNSAGNNVKDLVRWNPSRYLNVWVVNNIASGAGGYAYLPCVSNTIDGIVIRNAQFGTIGTSSPFGLSARSLTHEVGHYLGLPHTWGGTNTPGVASNCNTDDGIADTPNTVGVSNQSCNTNASSCSNLNNVQNYMDYSNCPKMFTLGQKAVMINALTNLSCRNSLVNQNNLIFTGTNDGFVATTCAPVVDFRASRQRICEGTAVQFTEMAYNAMVDNSWTWSWSFPGGTPSVSSDRNPIITYNSPGTYAVTLVATNAGGSDSVTRTNYIEVKSLAGLTPPVSESFEDPAFPVNVTEPNKSWEIDNTTTNTWERTSAAAIDGSFSMRIRHQFVATNRENSLVTPNIDLTNFGQPVLKFKVAYAQPSGSTTTTDRLRVLYSLDCGHNWILRYAKGGSTLATTTTTISGSTTFVPTSAQWREETINLPITAPYLMLKFESTSGNGNALYIDNVRVEGVLTGVAGEVSHNGLQIYPNPNNGQATISYELLQPSEVTLTITNAIGQEVHRMEKQEQTGRQEYQLSSLSRTLAPGVYMVTLRSARQVTVRKLVIE